MVRLMSLAVDVAYRKSPTRKWPGLEPFATRRGVSIVELIARTLTVRNACQSIAFNSSS